MAFNTKEQEIIKWGLANGKSKQEVSEAITNFRSGVTVPKKIEPEQPTEPGYIEGLKNDLNTRVDKFGDILNRQDTGVVEKGVQLFGQGAGLAANAIEKTAEQVPGVKQAISAMGAGIQWLTESAPIKALGNVIGSQKALQEAVKLYDTDQNFKDTVDAVANVVRLGGDVQLVSDALNFTKNVTNKIKAKAGEILPAPPSGAPPAPPGNPIEPILDIKKLTPESATIMNRVARLKPTDFTKFEKMAGKTPGEYLTETGNFGTPDKIITKEATKFTESMKSVDDSLAKLPGTFEDGSITDALRGLIEKAKNTSGDNVKSPYLDEVLRLEKKHASQGLTMEEINNVKRLYEKNVKLGYNKLTNGEKVEQATNIDNALREWQISKAEELGFNNIGELNKQTQLSKFLVDKLGDQIIGQSGLNGVSLTDYVMLAGGDPTAVAGFLTKKFFSSKAVQAKIAEVLNKGDVKGMIKPDVGVSQVKQLPEGKTGLPQVQINQPINLMGESTMEKSVPKTSTPQQLPQSKKVKTTSSNATTGKKK